MENTTESVQSKEEKRKMDGLLQTSLLMLGSALFGGIAVALWNRRTLASMQNPQPPSDFVPTPAEDDMIY
ncbi:hypothetical protein [Acidobacterium sp. S8]|uniref:hypothetical protein n=1 Tax=Acidobacterium sp. S8 TaxID=1641854 RepID=UPI00131AA552|nr:hypothetical protein [Acidobacterium sp. S8]